MAVTWKNGVLIMTAQGDGVSGRKNPTPLSYNADGTPVTPLATTVNWLNQMIDSITVVASADTWTVVLSDQGGSEIWRFTNTLSGNRGQTFYTDGLYTAGIVLTTASNITKVIMTTKTVQW